MSEQAPTMSITLRHRLVHLLQHNWRTLVLIIPFFWFE